MLILYHLIQKYPALFEYFKNKIHTRNNAAMTMRAQVGHKNGKRASIARTRFVLGIAEKKNSVQIVSRNSADFE